MRITDDLTILPSDYDGDDDDFEIVTVKISARTTEDDYRSRDLNNESIVVEDMDNLLIYFTGAGNYYTFNDYQNEREKSAVISETIGRQIAQLFSIDCPHGKYPEVTVSLDSTYYDIIKEDYDTDRGRGFIDAEYELCVFIRRGG